MDDMIGLYTSGAVRVGDRGLMGFCSAFSLPGIYVSHTVGLKRWAPRAHRRSTRWFSMVVPWGITVMSEEC